MDIPQIIIDHETKCSKCDQWLTPRTISHGDFPGRCDGKPSTRTRWVAIFPKRIKGQWSTTHLDRAIISVRFAQALHLPLVFAVNPPTEEELS